MLGELEMMIDDAVTNLLLPFATIIESGNHIAQLADGRHRRRFAQAFKEQVNKAIKGTAPWTPTQPLGIHDLIDLLDKFPDDAMRGVGLGDLSIIHEWKSACERHPSHRVRIWSLDRHLDAYDREVRRGVKG